MENKNERFSREYVKNGKTYCDIQDDNMFMTYTINEITYNLK